MILVLPFLIFNSCLFLGAGQAVPKQSRENFLKAKEEAWGRAKFEVEVCLDKIDELRKVREKKIAEKREALQAREKAELARKAPLLKAREMKIAKQKAALEAREKAELARKAPLLKAREMKIAKQKAALEAREKAELAKKEQLQRAREQKIAAEQAVLAKKQAAIEAKEQAALARKEQLRKERQLKKEVRDARIRAEKKAANKNIAAPEPSLGAKYMCELGVSSYRSGRYVEALAEFNKVLLVEPDNQVAQKYARKILKKLEQEKK